MYKYSRPVFYYETDKMGIVHHSNYIRWLEEARSYFFDDHNLSYVVTESLGVLSPIIDVSAKYKLPAKFGDVFSIKLRMTKYTGVRFSVVYTAFNQNGDVLLEAQSSHAFVDTDLRPVSLSKIIPERHERMKLLLKKHSEDYQ